MTEPLAAPAIKVRLFSGLGRTLIISILVFALLPMTMISIISYNKAYQILKLEISDKLSNVAELKTFEIESYFNRMLSQLRFHSETVANANLLQALNDGHNASGRSLAEYTESNLATLIFDKHINDMRAFRDAFGYYDIFLIGNDGDIHFTVAGESNLGTNLFTGENRSSKFAAAFKRTLETGKISFSDYERYAISGNEVFGYLTATVVNQAGERIGVLAFQFQIDRISEIMSRNLKMGETAETYLVGPDLTLRSNMVLDKERALIDKKINTWQTQIIKSEQNKDSSEEETAGTVSVYQGPHGREVLGIHNEFAIENVVFTVISEIETAEAFSLARDLRRTLFILLGLTILFVLVLAILIVRHIVKPVIRLSMGAKSVESGNYTPIPQITSGNEIGELGQSFNTMVAALKKNQDDILLKEWFQRGEVELNEVMRGNQELPELCRSIITFLARYLSAQIGALYITKNENSLVLIGSYAFSARKTLSNIINFGDGLVGQAALEKERILLTSVPEDYIAIQSGLGESTPHSIVVKPFMREGMVLGVLELGALNPFSKKALEFLDSVSKSIAVGIQTVISHHRVQELLEESQTQSEELQAQQEELREANETLEQQAETLKRSEADLQAQQEELRQTNEELEEQTRLLEEQKNRIGQKNQELENTRREIELKARDLDIASRYKSEFLANMSHELRTPLNSILLLSKHLSDNNDKNLTVKQIECATTVYSSGNELLGLINEVLDLSKIEAGQMTLELEDILLADITGSMKRNFSPVAESKGVGFDIHLHNGLPESVRTDLQRVSQILKNLLSNAFKFTKQGSVTLEIGLCNEDQSVAFAVKDTGPGIPEAKHEAIFQAFKQADGSTSREYGGTGLGLSISRELSGLLGGRLELTSTVGQGSTFTLYLPKSYSPPLTKMETVAEIEKMSELAPTTGEPVPEKPGTILQTDGKGENSHELDYVLDDRKAIKKNSKSILIIEDDPNFAKILRDTARERGFKALVAESGETALLLTDRYQPDGIILDMGLPGMSGKAVLFRLKDNLATRHIPVHVVSACDRTSEPLHMGAVGFLTKPVTMDAVDGAFSRIEEVSSRKVKEVLVVADNQAVSDMIGDLIGSSSVKTTTVASCKEARTLLDKQQFDCMILDLGLPDIGGLEFLNDFRKREDFYLPVIIYTARDLTANERARLDQLAGSIVIKNIKSQEKLLDETYLFLHRVEKDLPEKEREILQSIHNKEAILQDKKILIVDDDMRNVFALISILEDEGIKAVAAGNGREALDKLQENTDIDLVLMDIMMPEMDGYEAMQEIRKMTSKIAKVPIIALTAKAMKGDRVKSIAAGASDYLSKPVDTDKLLSMLRVWLY